jgi:hypothetical protein
MEYLEKGKQASKFSWYLRSWLAVNKNGDV